MLHLELHSNLFGYFTQPLISCTITAASEGFQLPETVLLSLQQVFFWV